MSSESADRSKRAALLDKLRKEHSATIIQARVRGMLYRRAVERMKKGDITDDEGDEVEEAADQPALKLIQQIQEEEKSETSSWPPLLVENMDDPSWPPFVDLADAEAWVLAHKKVYVRNVTWNLCARQPPPVQDTFRSIFPLNRFHLFVIGSEECERSIAQSAVNTSKKNWEAYISNALGKDYSPIKSHTLQAIHIICYAHHSIAHLITDIASAAVPTGLGNTLGNKGGTGIFFRIGLTTFVFANAHLAAHQNAVKQRNADCNKICKDLPLLLLKKGVKGKGRNSSASSVSSASASAPSVPAAASHADPPDNIVIDDSEGPISFNFDGDQLPEIMNPTENAESAKIGTAGDEVDGGIGASADGVAISTSVGEALDDAATVERTQEVANEFVDNLLDFADHVFFMGDLNYRIDGKRAMISALLAKNMHEVLLCHDQLRKCLAGGLVLKGFSEPPLNFRPTYKFDVNSDSYDSGPKKRSPAWTDRILFGESKRIQCIAYSADFRLRSSDHRPVYASFVCDVAFEMPSKSGTQTETQGLLGSRPQYHAESQVCAIM